MSENKRIRPYRPMGKYQAVLDNFNYSTTRKRLA